MPDDRPIHTMACRQSRIRSSLHGHKSSTVQYGVKAIRAYMQCFAMIAQNKLFKMAALYRIDKFKHFFILFFFSYLKGRLIILI